MNLNILQEIGLTAQEAKIYTALCSEPLTTLAGVTRITGVHRPQLYKLLPVLVDKKLLEKRQIGKRTHYRAVEPRVLYDLLQKKYAAAAGVIDELQVAYEQEQQKPDISFKLGPAGYQALFDDIADVVPIGGQIYRYTARDLSDTSFKCTGLYCKRRDAGHFERLVISSATKAINEAKRQNRFVKVVPPEYDMFDDNVSQTIYADRIAFVDHENETTFIITSSKIASMQKKLFKLMWRNLKDQDYYQSSN